MNRGLLILLVILCTTGVSLAEKRSYIDAERMEWNDKTGVTQFFGSVRYRYPTDNVTIEADSLEIRHKDKVLISVIAQGKPVHFQQQVEGEKPITGHALHLYYDARAEKVKLSGDARLQSGQDSLEGEVILYDVRSQTAEVSGDQQQGERFEAIIHSSPKDDKAQP